MEIGIEIARGGECVGILFIATVVITAMLTVQPVEAELANRDYHGEEHEYAASVVANWGQPPSYARWFGDVDDGGFFGISAIEDGNRGIVRAFSATFEECYEGRFVIVRHGEAVKIEDMEDIKISSPMYEQYVRMKVNNRSCEMLVLERDKFESIEPDGRGGLVKIKPLELRCEGNDVDIPALGGPDLVKLTVWFVGDGTVMISGRDRSSRKKVSSARIRNTVSDCLSCRDFSHVVIGSRKFYLMFHDGGFVPVDDFGLLTWRLVIPSETIMRVCN